MAQWVKALATEPDGLHGRRRKLSLTSCSRPGMVPEVRQKQENLYEIEDNLI